MKIRRIYSYLIHNMSRANHDDTILKKYNVKIHENNKELPYISYGICENNTYMDEFPINLIHKLYINIFILYHESEIYSKKEDALYNLLSSYKNNKIIEYTHVIEPEENEHSDPSESIIHMHIIYFNLSKPTNPTKQDYKNVKTYKKLIEDIKKCLKINIEKPMYRNNLGIIKKHTKR